MPRYYLDTALDKWAKRCSHCEKITVGTADEAESFAIFQTMFADAGPSSGMADGLQSRCWMCNCSGRREIGATRDIVEQLYKQQNGKCGICAIDISIERSAVTSKKAHVDHDPKSGMIRELLCGNCNRGIGTFFHDPIRLRAAAIYCEHYNTACKQTVDLDES